VKITKTVEVPPIETPEGIMRPLLFGTNASLIHLEVPSGTEVAPHAHPNEGLVYCISGKVELTHRKTTIPLLAGSAAKVPAAQSIGMRNPGPWPAKMLLISAPPAASSFEELKARVEAALSHDISDQHRNSEEKK